MLSSPIKFWGGNHCAFNLLFFDILRYLLAALIFSLTAMFIWLITELGIIKIHPNAWYLP
ncbi:hypothetical protein HBA_0944 [Sodalis endosymbiont of Henestaris halophilus]|nr:hypothetical protein HBA_0944 [Sodalis endosymbiont of Henestaris halophilus]